jgi:ATP/maltotriose-dependent transcriptional regulator MalT
MELLEREAALADLAKALDDVEGGIGTVVLIAGEAGIGKTRLVQAFALQCPSAVRVLWGGCDDLTTPRPLGPFRDIAASAGGALDEVLSTQPSRRDLFDALSAALRSPNPPTVLVVEDVHWADAATLDVLKFLGRRIDRLPVLLVITYRAEEIGPGHPLATVIGDVPAYATRRVDLAPLSHEAVAILATAYPGSVDELYTITGGNPFLVTEALSVPELDVPPGVRDAVIAKLARLTAEARGVAEAAAVVPGRAERAVLEQIVAVDDDMLDEGWQRGLLEFDARAVWYRHELVRGAVLETLDERRKVEINAAVLAALTGGRADVARIVHHALEAGDADAVAEYGPIAARQAAAVSAHREAVAHYRASVAHLDHVPPADRAELLIAYAIEAYLTGDSATAIESAGGALDLARKSGDVQRQGVALRWLSRFHWWLGQPKEAEIAGQTAIALLESVPGSSELPMAYSNLAQLHMLAHNATEAESWATKAIESARAIGDASALAHALNNLGSTRARAGNSRGIDLLRESLDLSLAEGLEDHAGRAYANLIWTLLDVRRFDEARRCIADGLGYAEKRELEGSLYYITAERARLHLCTGNWKAAERDARRVIGRPEEPGITRMPALATLAQLQVRLGSEAATESIEIARMLAEPTGELQRIGPVALAQGEHAWLSGDLSELRRAIEPVYAMAVDAAQPWVLDEFAFWMWRAGLDVETRTEPATPFAMQMQGDWLAAADTWDELGCPYERAMALFDATTPRTLVEALGVLDELAAMPAARLVRRKLHALGVRSVPRGPRPSTRANPAGLTTRQLEVLRLLAQGFTNAEIADQLFVSPKTVDHHVSAILAKLEAGSRREAARIAHRLDLVPIG